MDSRLPTITPTPYDVAEIFKTGLIAKTLFSRQQALLLRAFTGADWQVLDLSLFDPWLITNKVVTDILKGSKQPVLELNLSGCDPPYPRHYVNYSILLPSPEAFAGERSDQVASVTDRRFS